MNGVQKSDKKKVTLIVTKKLLLSVYVSGFPMNLIHAAATVIFLAILGEPMMKKLDRIKKSMGYWSRDSVCKRMAPGFAKPEPSVPCMSFCGRRCRILGWCPDHRLPAALHSRCFRSV